MDIFLIVLSGCLILLVVLLLRRNHPGGSGQDQSMLLIQQQMESLRSELRESLRGFSQATDRQLSLVSQQLQAQTGTVGSRLDGAARAMMDVQRNLGELGKATEEIKELGRSVSTLEQLLKAPKLRGGLGEFLLEELLRQVLPSDSYEFQHRFRNGQIVDAVIRTADGLVPVDSKFPLENFRKILSASTEGETASCQKAFGQDVKRHIDAIAGKYILPDEGTYPFALMYIPAENIFYEVIIKDEGGTGSGVHAYALERNVIPVSPNSFYAYLQVIALGLRGLRVEERAREIMDMLGRLDGDIAHVREAFDVLGTHMENARKKYEEAGRNLNGVEYKLSTLSERAMDGGSAERNAGHPHI
jgi:DNA recombination protein RmuC